MALKDSVAMVEQRIFFRLPAGRRIAGKCRNLLRDLFCVVVCWTLEGRAQDKGEQSLWEWHGLPTEQCLTLVVPSPCLCLTFHNTRPSEKDPLRSNAVCIHVLLSEVASSVRQERRLRMQSRRMALLFRSPKMQECAWVAWLAVVVLAECRFHVRGHTDDSGQVSRERLVSHSLEWCLVVI